MKLKCKFKSVDHENEVKVNNVLNCLRGFDRSCFSMFIEKICLTILKYILEQTFLKRKKPTISNPAIGLVGSFWSGSEPIHRITPYNGGACITSTIEPISKSGSAGGIDFILLRAPGGSIDWLPGSDECKLWDWCSFLSFWSISIILDKYI